ncbi:MAG: SUMF1/EgtB/PvdO family nonheme iron enzyme [Cyanobacteria bacterium J06626_18]
MTFSFTRSATSGNPTLAELRQILRDDMAACRQSTLELINNLSIDEFRQQSHPDFSPVGWHLGHIAFTESLWLLEHLKEDRCSYPHYQKLFAADGLPKAERENLPDLPEILAFMQDIRDRTFTYLETAPLYDQLRLWRWLVQHESQHAETATYVLALHHQSQRASQQQATAYGNELQPGPTSASKRNMVLIPSGKFEMGSTLLDALDNERPSHWITIKDYWLDCTPVTVADYAAFMAAGGYQNSQWWRPEGWTWVQKQGITQPLYWQNTSATWEDTPVCGVSWYEADAYSCFVGKRLPTEAEWEYAAHWQPEQDCMQLYPWGDAPLAADRGNFGSSRGGVTPVGAYPKGRSATGCDDLLGNVWEWTNSCFEGYPDFVPYPYPGYSQTYFDDKHRVLRGGSWATRPWVLRPTFRNWYHPWIRQIFSGFRCALSA